MKYDFGGYVTKNDLKCSDGRIIRQDAFKSCDGKRVPLVYQHQHRELDNVLGFVDLENRDDGVYGYGSFNATPQGQAAKAMVEHGDLTQMSIYANNLKERSREVFHGIIREVSLVLSGANPGATIDNLNLVHSDGSFDLIEDEATIRSGIDIDLDLSHAEDEEKSDAEEAEEPNDEEQESAKTVQDIVDGMNDEKKKVLELFVSAALAGGELPAIEEDESVKHESVKHADSSEAEEAADESEPETDVKKIFDTFTDDEKKVTYYLVAQAAKTREEVSSEESENAAAEESAENDQEKQNDISHADNNGGETMAHNNIFDQDNAENTSYLTHADINNIFHDAQSRFGSLKDAWNAFAEDHEIDPASLTHGITNVGEFFPEAQLVNNQPAMITRRMEWVSVVLDGVHKSPFSKVKSMAANLTAEDARARGYFRKGNQKTEETIAALKRVTNPTTIYKLQKLDRDDVIDITDFDVVAWMKAEMRMMLDEEVARAYLVGDGRAAGSNDKIDEQCIRPIWTDNETYAIHTLAADNSDRDVKAQNFIDAAIEAQDDYKGSGSPTMFIGTKLLTSLRLIRNQIGERMYKNDQELADELRVARIVPVEIMNNLTRTVNEKTRTLGAIIVNLTDYNVGATRGGEVNLFDDFDLNLNKLEYLIETRQSGALVKPASALVVEFEAE